MIEASAQLPAHSRTVNPQITVTGADERTDLGALSELNAEIGLLYTATPEGRNRYPSMRWLVRATSFLPRVAIHICGSIARNELRRGWLGDLVAHAQRIQVNGHLSIEEAEDICALYYTHTIITQHTTGSGHLFNVTAPNHALLIDGSGGRGVSPAYWPRIKTTKAVGFAGGLGPDNIPTEVGKIRKVSANGWWIDMEGKLRVDDWFSIERAKEAIWAFERATLEAAR